MEAVLSVGPEVVGDVLGHEAQELFLSGCCIRSARRVIV